MSDNEDFEAVEVDLAANGGKYLFLTPDSMREFVSIERSAWSWASTSEMKSWGLSPGDKSTKSLSRLQSLIGQFEAGQVNANQVKVRFEEIYAPASGDISAVHSNSISGKFIEELRVSHGDRVAGAALTTVLRHELSLLHYDHVVGMVAMAANSLGINAQTPEAVSAVLLELSGSYSDRIAKSTAQDAANQKKREAVMQQVERSINVLSRWSLSRGKVQRTKIQRDFQISVDEFKAVEAAYREDMALKAPVEYWRDKAQGHEQGARNHKWWLMIYAPAVTLILIAVLATLAFVVWKVSTPELIDGVMISRPASIYLILGTIGLVISTVAFWVGRILVKLYMSQLHLAADAREKETMAMAYLALVADKSTDRTEDRHLILPSLFRSAADGLVKDDTSPDTSIAAHLARIFEQGTRR